MKPLTLIERAKVNAICGQLVDLKRGLMNEVIIRPGEINDLVIKLIMDRLENDNFLRNEDEAKRQKEEDDFAESQQRTY